MAQSCWVSVLNHSDLRASAFFTFKASLYPHFILQNGCLGCEPIYMERQPFPLKRAHSQETMNILMQKHHEDNARAWMEVSLQSQNFKGFQTIWFQPFILKKKAKAQRGLVACLRSKSYLVGELGLEYIFLDIQHQLLMLQNRLLEATVSSQAREP